MTGDMAALAGIRLSVGGVRPGWYCVDNRAGGDIDLAIDLECYPWPLPDACAVQAYAGHVVARINPARFGFIHFMNELWRLLIPGGELTIATYYGINSRYQADPAACNPMTETTLRYFDPAHKSRLWSIYQPHPWEVRGVQWDSNGNLEALIAKR